mgnify:CR=1 FL=1
MNKKWKISEIKNSKKLKDIADIILRQRINIILDLLEKYLKNKTIENLHDVRIGLRRVRYNLELFLVCYDESTFSKFYNKIEKLQNLSGEVRDLDVLLLNLEKLKESGVLFENSLIEKVKENRASFEVELNNQINKFLKSKALKKFLKEINLERSIL